jgi:hypothetical protein
MVEQFVNAAQSTLSESITDSVTELTVTSATKFPGTGDFRIVIDSEIMIVTGVAGNVFTVTRAAETTTATSHAELATVGHTLTNASLENKINIISPRTMDGLDDVTITGLNQYDVLAYSGTEWANVTEVQGAMSARSASSANNAGSAAIAGSATNASSAQKAYSASWLRGASTNVSGHALVFSSGVGGSSWAAREKVPSAYLASSATKATSAQQANSASWLQGGSTNSSGYALVFSSGGVGQNWRALSKVPSAANASSATRASSAIDAGYAGLAQNASYLQLSGQAVQQSSPSAGMVMVGQNGRWTGQGEVPMASHASSAAEANNAISASSAASAVMAGTATTAASAVRAATLDNIVPAHGNRISYSSGTTQAWVAY